MRLLSKCVIEKIIESREMAWAEGTNLRESYLNQIRNLGQVIESSVSLFPHL